jgi:hypothetical protein
MLNFCAACGCCTRTDIVREHLEDTLRICDVSAKGLLYLFCIEFALCLTLDILASLVNAFFLVDDFENAKFGSLNSRARS